MPLSREDYIMQYGVDPDTGEVPAASSNDDSGVMRYGKDLAVGALTIPTDFYALGPLAWKGAKALYNSYADDKPFTEEFAKEMQVEDAQKNIQQHLGSIAQKWKADNPEASEEDINNGLKEYMKSKQYEDFTMSQLTHAPYVAAKWKDTVRNLLGDTKTEDQHTWADTGAEVIGGALVPGVGWASKVGQAANTAGGVTAKIANNVITRGALKTAEVLTPLTMPYTGTNIAVNAGVGVGVDQALRYAQSKPTMFNSDESNTVAKVGAGALAVGGFAAFVGAVRGRAAQVAMQGVQIPQTPTGMVRFYHGGADPTSGGGRWLTPQEDYARNFRSGGTPNEVHYVDIPEQRLQGGDLSAGYDDINNYYRHFDAPEDVALQLKPVPLPGSVSPTASALRNTPTLDTRVSDPARPGESIIRGGPEAQYGPPPSLDSSVGGAVTKGEGLLFDETAPLYRTVQREHGTNVADTLEQSRMANSYAVMNDTLPAEVSNAIQGVHDTLSAMTPEESRAMRAGWWLASDSAQNRIRLDEARAQEAELTARIAHPNTTPQNKAQATKDLAQLQYDIQRFVTDQRSARPRIPDIPMQTEQDFVNTFLKDQSPHVVKFREQVEQLNRKVLDLQVASGELSQATADEMHRLNPYFVRSINDPLKGKTGFARLWESASQSINRALTRKSEGTGAAALHESPLRHLDKGIPQEKVPGAPETRITMPLDALSSARQYLEQAYRSAGYTRTRNEFIAHLAWEHGLGVNGVKTQFHQDGHMQIVHSPSGSEWWTGNQLSQAADAMRRPNVVAEWQNGQLRLWEFGDSAIAQGLRMEPTQLTGMMKFMSQTTNIMKAFTTGRFAPWFAPLGAMYNSLIGILTRPANRAFGTGSYWAMRILPEGFAKHTIGRLPDITQPLTMPYHLARAVIELQTYHLTQPIVRQLLKSTPFATLQQAVGAPQFNRMINTVLKVASWAEQSPSVLLHKAGATIGHQSIDNIPSVRTAFTQIADSVPGPIKGAWQFYKDGLDAIYLADKRMYFTQNYALLDMKYKKMGMAVPQHEIDRLVRETRVLAGDMAKVPASKAMQDLERIFPYLTQTKLGAYHLMRHMGSADTASYVVPRVLAMTNMIAASFYMMTYWNDEARKEFWERTPEYQRWKFAYIPTVKLMTAWASGQNLPYSRDLYYKVPIPPDIAPMVAGTVAMWQMLGGIPADATPKPIANDLFKILSDNLTPAMPPLLQTVLGASGMRLDPQSSEMRGGDWIRNMAPRFKSGPQAESVTNLGQISNSTALMMNGIMGATGANLVAGMDVMLHAGKFKMDAGGAISRRESFNFAEGLRAATSEVLGKTKEKVPDVPLLWQGKDKYATSTASWQYVREQDVHVNAIKDMRNDMMGKAAQRNKELARAAGGVAPQALTDQALGALADEVSRWQNPTGELGKLKKVYRELGVQQRSVMSQYNLPQEERTRRTNAIVRMMQDNMVQQYLASKNAEIMIANKYGSTLAPLLNGRHLTFATIDSLMRESIGSGKQTAVQQQPAEVE